MPESPADRRRAENEVFFRQENERVQKFVQQRSAERKRREPKLHFFCECFDETCHERIVMTPTKYQRLHANRNQFIVKPGHSNATIERVMRSEPEYTVVEKYMTPPDSVDGLNPTTT